MTVSLVEIFAAARAHAAPLAAESAGYLLLAVADHLVSAPRSVDPDDVELSSDGGVRLRASRGAAGGSEGAEATVRQLLSRALEVSGSAGPALRRAADRREDAGLPALVRELEVALIPVNRAAAKRALSRLHRETERARDAGKLERFLSFAPAVPAAAPAAVAAVEASAPPPAFVAPSPAPPPLAPVPPPPVVEASPRRAAPAPVVELTLTPEPYVAVGEPALTKPEPVVLRARERGSSTPRLGTVVTAQTLPGEEADRTERAPEVVAEEAPEELELSVEVELPAELEAESDDETPALPEKRLAALEPAPPAPWTEPEPSLLPDVLTAMVELHTGFDSDEAPTRLRAVVTELRYEEAPAVEALEEASSDEPGHEQEQVPDGLESTPEPEPAARPLPAVTLTAFEPLVTPEPEQVEDTWLTSSSLEGVLSAPTLFVSERVAPELHEALTWDPGPVICTLPSPVPPALLIAEPALEPSPYAPAVLSSTLRDVSELLESFHVSGAAEEQELRSALKEMAGMELTPMPHPLVEER